MPRDYMPRRASKRWLEGAPAYILDVFDSRNVGERYTVLFGRPFTTPGPYSKSLVQYLGMSGSPTHPQGISLWGEFTAYQASDYRYRFKRHRIRWLDLPEHIRAHVIARAEDD